MNKRTYRHTLTRIKSEAKATIEHHDANLSNWDISKEEEIERLYNALAFIASYCENTLHPVQSQGEPRG